MLLLVSSMANAGGGFGALQNTEFLWLIAIVLVGVILFAAYRMKG